VVGTISVLFYLLTLEVISIRGALGLIWQRWFVWFSRGGKYHAQYREET
jgi:hypothetical protein